MNMLSHTHADQEIAVSLQMQNCKACCCPAGHSSIHAWPVCVCCCALQVPFRWLNSQPQTYSNYESSQQYCEFRSLGSGMCRVYAWALEWTLDHFLFLLYMAKNHHNEAQCVPYQHSQRVWEFTPVLLYEITRFRVFVTQKAYAVHVKRPQLSFSVTCQLLWWWFEFTSL